MKRNQRIERQTRRLLNACTEAGQLNEAHVLEAIDVLIESKDRSRFLMLRELLRRLRAYQHQRTAVVESAVPLSKQMQSRLHDELQQAYSSAIEVSFVTNPELIGGMRIKAADDVYDGSIRGKLAALETTFTSEMYNQRESHV